jgi:hypothetical protein
MIIKIITNNQLLSKQLKKDLPHLSSGIFFPPKNKLFVIYSITLIKKGACTLYIHANRSQISIRSYGSEVSALRITSTLR